MLEQQYQEIIDLMDEIYGYLTGNKWREKSEVRLNILLTTRLDGLKHQLSELNFDELLDSEKQALYLENLIERVNNILLNLPKDKFTMQYYDLELFRLQLASMYTLSWGQAGELQITGAAHALANVLIGIKSLSDEEIRYLVVDWNHPEHYKRRKLLLNFLSSAYLFFFSLCTSLDLIYKHDAEEWLSEGFRFGEYFLKYIDYFWNVPKTVEVLSKLPRYGRGPNFSPYYATFAGIGYFITLLLDLQKFFFNPEIKISNYEKIVDIYDVEEFFDGIYRLIKRVERYVADLKTHVKNGIFNVNENPFDDPMVKETIKNVEITKIISKGYHAVYRIVTKDIASEINIIEKEIIPMLFKELEENKKYYDAKEFLVSQKAELVAIILEEMLFFSGVVSQKTGKYKLFNKVEQEVKQFLNEQATQRFPNLAGFYYVLKATLDIERGQKSKLIKYAKKLEKIAEYSVYQPRNSFSFALLALLLRLITDDITIDEFLDRIIKLHEYNYPALSPQLNEEIEIYIKNMQLSLIGGITPAFDLKRLLSPKHYDKYSIFIPDIRKVITSDELSNIIYLPFNLEKDCIVVSKPVIAEIQQTNPSKQ